MKGKLKRLLPWAVSLGLLAYLGLTTDLARVWDSFARAPMGLVVAIAIAGSIVAFVYDSFSLTVLFRRFHGGVPFSEILPLKGASYFLNILNYNAAMGGMALYLKRVRRIPFLESASSLLFMNVLDVFLLCGFIGMGLALGGETISGALSVESSRALLTVLVAFGALLVGTWIYWNAGFDFFVLGRLRKLSIFHAFREARIKDYGALMLLRLPMVLIYVAITWVFAQLFGFRIPFTTMMVLQPIIIFVGTIPVSIAGLGTTQVVMRSFYGGFAAFLVLLAPAGDVLPSFGGMGLGAPGGAVAAVLSEAHTQAALQAYLSPVAAVDAFSFGAIFTVILVRVALGYAFLQRVSERIADAGEPEETTATEG